MRFVLLLLFLPFSISSFGQIPDTLLMISPDSLLRPHQQNLNSIEQNFYQQSDSIKTDFKQKLSGLDSSRAKLQSQFDSLKTLRLPTEKISQKLDSANQLQSKMIADLNQKMDDLKSKTVGQVKNLSLPPELQEKVSALTKNIEGFQLPVKDLNIPSLDLPDNPLKSLDGLSSSFKSPLDNIGGIDGLPDMQGKLGEVSKVTDQLGGYQEDLKNITQGNLDDVKQLQKTLEDKAADLSGLNDISDQTKMVDPLLDAAKDPEALKELAKEKVKEAAIDHFAGKEEVLKQAMEKVSNLKQKYSNVSSLNDIPKKRPNAMRGKPLVERLLPGIAIQFQKKNDDFLTDINPYVGYRFTGRLTGGVGWNQRIPYNFQEGTFNQTEKVFGPRIFSEFKLKHGFTPRAELESMNTYVPVIIKPGTADIQTQQWVFGAFVGLKKDYYLIRKVKGTAMIMLRVFNHDHRSPYADVLNVRFGFEFPMKKKRKG